ncbi:hypothetical protein GCM10025767_18760 [Thalassotalea piscium]|uniref:Uncharacterized protein n=1 Tax=Thalassotalea piscium TaxID=1230533 RepID=A0A7X0TSL9_9GAMM|nr:hypothetical protein [Thalassotalea piscium]
MSFQDKLNAANKELSMSKMSKYSYNSPICFLLNAIGFNARPLHYNTFLSNFIILSVWFSSAWGGDIVVYSME